MNIVLLHMRTVSFTRLVKLIATISQVLSKKKNKNDQAFLEIRAGLYDNWSKVFGLLSLTVVRFEFLLNLKVMTKRRDAHCS